MNRLSPSKLKALDNSDLTSNRRIAKNFSIRVGSRVFSIVISILAMSLAARHFGEAGFGDYSFWYSLIFFLPLIFDLGFTDIIVREIARKPDNVSTYFGDAILFRVFNSVLIFSILWIVARWTLAEPHYSFFLIVCATAILAPNIDVSTYLFRGTERMEYEAALLIIGHIFWIAFLYVFIRLEQPMVLILCAKLFAYICRTVIGFIILALLGFRPIFRLGTSHFREYLKSALPVGVSLVVALAYEYVGMFQLRLLGTAEEVGYWNIAITLLNGFRFFAITLAISYYPLLSRNFYSNDNRLEVNYSRFVKYLIIMALPITIIVFAFADEIIRLMFDGGFAESVVALRIIVAGMTVVFLNVGSRFVMIAFNLQKIYLRNELIGILLNICLGVVFILKFGLIGACFSLVISGVIKLWLHTGVIKKHASMVNFNDVFFKPIGAGVVMGAIVFFIFEWVADPITVIVGGTAYLLALVLFKAFSDEETLMFRNLFAHKLNRAKQT